MSDVLIETIDVLLGGHKRADPELFGPLPGRRCGNILAFEMQAPENFEPWPGRSRVERKYALLDVGVMFGVPCWGKATQADGSTLVIPSDQQGTWYVDLVSVQHDDQDRYVLRDLFIDVMIGDDRHPRMLDLDEIADACEAGWISRAQLLDGLRRWQTFLDRHLYPSRFPSARLSDFPPAAIEPLAAIPGFFGPPVTWPG